MINSQAHPVDWVKAGSPADRAGIKKGWQLLRIDNRTITDIIDYKIAESDEVLRLLMMTDQGILRRIKIHKPAASPLGIVFSSPTINSPQQCQNRCIFCFIEQNPPGLRKTLYLKDDDYRLSFLFGNFITLNRLTEKEMERILRLQLSPLYVSVHTTNPVLRQVMFGSKNAVKGLQNLDRLINAGIRIHAQVVLCPDYNSGDEMEKTVTELEQMGANLLSTALVPVGLTRHRQGLPQLKKITPAQAKSIIKKAHELQNHFLRTRGSRFVFLADEFYNLAGLSLPGHEEYENYPQLENGVGLARQFLNELETVAGWAKKIKKLPAKLSITLVSGLAARPQLNKLVEKLKGIENLAVSMVFVKNLFFGEQVTVSGLLTGGDLLAALKGKNLGDVVFIPKVMLNENNASMLDDLTLKDLERALKVPVRTVSGPAELMGRLLETADNREID